MTHDSAPVMKQSAVYIMASKAKGTLYTSKPGNLKRRVWKHRKKLIEVFTRHYAIYQPVRTTRQDK